MHPLPLSFAAALRRPPTVLLLTLLASAVLSAAEPPKVYRDSVTPHWFDDNNRFWYRNDLRDGTREFVLVDANAATRQPAFDHARVAAALSQSSGSLVDPARLPIDSLEFKPDALTLLLRGATNGWSLNLQSGELTPDPAARIEAPSLPAEADPRPSRSGGPETEIAFVNRLDTEVQLFWIDPDDNRQPYGVIAAGQERRQHTFARHVWLVTRHGTNVAAFEAAPQRGTAIIQNSIEPRPRRGDRRSRASQSAADGAVRSPDNRMEAFVREHNLWIRTLPSGEEHPLTTDASATNSFHKDSSRDRLIGMEYEKPEAPDSLPEVFWSPDGTRLVALQTQSVPERRVHLVESSPRDQLHPRLLSYPYLKAGDPIPTQTPRLFDAASRSERPVSRDLFPTPWSLSDIRWATNSARFTFVFNQRGHQLLRLLAVDAATGSVRTVVEEQSPTFIDYSGKFLCEWLGDDELLWMSERDGWNHLYLYDVTSGQLKHQVTRGPWVVRKLERVDRHQRQVGFQAGGLHPDQDPYHVHLARADLDGTHLTPLTTADGTHSVQWSPDHRFLLDTWSRVDLPPVTELRRADTGQKLCSLEQADATEVLENRGRFPERFRAKGRDGSTDIFGILHRPRTFDPARRYPVLECIYAGPHDAHVPKSYRSQYRHQQDLADRGFIIVQIDGMGTSWRSKSFQDVAWRNLKDAGFPDRIAWMKAAAARFPELDLARVGIYGGSAGGQNALAALLWHGDFYRAAVADCGCHDNRMDKIWWSEQWMGWPLGSHYDENSNVIQAHRLQGSLLLVVGELDKNVDPSSTYQVAAALQRAGKPHELLVVMGAGHGAAETPYGSQRRAAFFIEKLRPD